MSNIAKFKFNRIQNRLEIIEINIAVDCCFLPQILLRINLNLSNEMHKNANLYYRNEQTPPRKISLKYFSGYLIAIKTNLPQKNKIPTFTCFVILYFQLVFVMVLNSTLQKNETSSRRVKKMQFGDHIGKTTALW